MVDLFIFELFSKGDQLKIKLANIWNFPKLEMDPSF